MGNRYRKCWVVLPARGPSQNCQNIDRFRSPCVFVERAGHEQSILTRTANGAIFGPKGTGCCVGPVTSKMTSFCAMPGTRSFVKKGAKA